MKLLSYSYLLLLLLFTACKPEGTQATEAIEAPVNDETDSALIAAEAAALKGLWLSDGYLKNVEHNKSIYASRDFKSLVFGFSIESDSLAANKLFFNGFSTNEGGYDGVLAFHEGKNKFVHLSTGEKHEIIKQSFEVKALDKNTLQLNLPTGKAEAYRRITDIDDMLRHVLFEGTYSDDEGNTVVFKSDGSLTGITDKGFYVLLYTFDAGYEFDTVFVSLNKEQDNFDRYHFKIEGNTLNLYAILENENEELSIGELQYRLVKK
jgi:hypothetical protein